MRVDLYKILLAAAVASWPLAASAQNLDPTVEVNRSYEGKLIEVNKPMLEMAVPDSVLRFDLEFDYEVFDNPYKGAYEFKPYTMQLQPVGQASQQQRLYMKLGAGNGLEALSLRPTADFVWSPVLRERFKMDVYASHRSYVGEYHSADPPDPSQETVNLRMRNSYGRVDYDFLTKAGMDARYDWADGTVRVDAGYYGLAERYGRQNNRYNALDVRAGVASKDYGQFINYDVYATYRFGTDRYEYRHLLEDSLTEHEVSVLGKLKAVLMDDHKAMFELGVDSHSYGYTGVTKLTFAPHYLFRYGKWGFDAGFRVEALVPANDSTCFSTKGQVVYPDVTVDYQVIPGVMKAYAKIGGGTKVNSFSSLLAENHHFDMYYGHGKPFMDNTIENISASLGLEGRAGARFTYGVSAGYAMYGNAPLETVVTGSYAGDEELMFLPGIAYAGYQTVYAAADLSWVTERIRIDGNAMYRHSWFEDIRTDGYFLPAALTGEFAFEYNWNRRIFLGLDCEFATGRCQGSVLFPDGTLRRASVPGYADLGVNFEYLTTRSFSVWFRGGNLLNMAIQRNLLYAEKGLCLALGICLNL